MWQKIYISSPHHVTLIACRPSSVCLKTCVHFSFALCATYMFVDNLVRNKKNTLNYLLKYRNRCLNSSAIRRASNQRWRTLLLSWRLPAGDETRGRQYDVKTPAVLSFLDSVYVWLHFRSLKDIIYYFCLLFLFLVLTPRAMTKLRYISRRK